MATTTARKHSAVRPIMEVWNQAKDLEYSEKLELVTMLIESVKPLRTMPMDYSPQEEQFSDMEKELYTPEEAYELTMRDIKAIYDRKDAI